MSEIPEFFIQELKNQVTEQYKIIIRYRDLRNNAEMGSDLRARYAQEISLRQQNIHEIQTEFLNNVQNTVLSVSQSQAQQIAQAVIHQVRQDLDVIKSDLKVWIKQFNLDVNTSLSKIEANIRFLQSQQREGTLELADLILDIAERQENTDQKIAEVLPEIKEGKDTNVLEAKLKLAVPLLEYLGIAKVELEVESNLSTMGKQVWALFKKKSLS